MMKISKAIATALLCSQSVNALTSKTVTEVLQESPEWTLQMTKELLLRHDLNHLLYTDVQKLMAHLGTEFKDMIKIKQFGDSYQGRPMLMIELDAREFLLKKLGTKGDAIREKLDPVMPAIMLTGAHHAREFASIQMPLFSILRLIHGGIIHDSEHYQNLLIQNKYYLIPIVNVDAVAHIEEVFVKTGKLEPRRKSMNMSDASPEDCPNPGWEEKGIDLNRNYAVDWDTGMALKGGNSDDPCQGSFRGKAPFSEPEIRAFRDFLIAHQKEIKFVYNFHTYGNMYLWPYNGASPNDIETRNPGVMGIFQDIVKQSTWPSGTIHASAWGGLHYQSSGEAEDWILGQLGIPAVCPEIGSDDYFSEQFTIPYRKIMVNILNQNLNWLENTYKIIGTQVELSPLGYSANKDGSAMLYLDVNNKGLTDQMMKDFQIQFGDEVHVLTEDTGFAANNADHHIKVNGLKRRDAQIVGVPVRIDAKAHKTAECIATGCDDISLRMVKPEIHNFVNQKAGKLEQYTFQLLSQKDLKGIHLAGIQKEFEAYKNEAGKIDSPISFNLTPNERTLPDRELAKHLLFTNSGLLMNLEPVHSNYNFIL